jgi:hypothetical protein
MKNNWLQIFGWGVALIVAYEAFRLLSTTGVSAAGNTAATTAEAQQAATGTNILQSIASGLSNFFGSASPSSGAAEGIAGLNSTTAAALQLASTNSGIPNDILGPTAPDFLAQGGATQFGGGTFNTNSANYGSQLDAALGLSN